QLLPHRTGHPLDSFQPPRQPPHPIGQKAGIGRITDVGLYHCGIHPSPPTANQSLLLAQLKQAPTTAPRWSLIEDSPHPHEVTADHGVCVGVGVALAVGVLLGVRVGVLLGVRVGVRLGVLVGVLHGVRVGVVHGVGVGVLVGVRVGVLVGVRVGVLV